MGVSQAEFEYNENYSGQSTDTYTSTTTGTTGEFKLETKNPPKMYGWICPVCGRGLSPFTSVCPCQDKWEITCESR